jgi:voltage-gated potassium channel Kch
MEQKNVEMTTVDSPVPSKETIHANASKEKEIADNEEVIAVETKKPWTLFQKIFSFVIFIGMFVGGVISLTRLNRETEQNMRPERGATVNVITIATTILSLIFTLGHFLLTKKWCHGSNSETFSFGKHILSLHSVPYQLWLGIWAILWIGVWVDKLENQTIVDVDHCMLSLTEFKELGCTPRSQIVACQKHVLSRIIRVNRPTYINQTAVNLCLLDQDVVPVKGLGPTGKPIFFDSTWYEVKDSDQSKAWNNYLLDVACTAVFAVHITIVALYNIYTSNNNDKAFSVFNIFTLHKGLYLMDIVIVYSVLLVFQSDNLEYNSYMIGGTFRFLLLFHPIFCAEYYLNERKERIKVYDTCSMVSSIVIASAKLIFVCLMGASVIFMAELPCKVVLEEGFRGNCDDNFLSFGNTVYFTFVTLSTVGYGDMSPKTPLGKVLIIGVILFGIAYLPGAISDVIHMYTQNEVGEMSVEEDDLDENSNTDGSVRKHSTRENALLRQMLKEVRELKKGEYYVQETLKKMDSQRQIGYFQHGGTLNTNHTSTKGSDGASDSLTRSRSLVSNSIFEDRCSILEKIHGETKISLCLAVLGLDPTGGSKVLLSHVLGSDGILGEKVEEDE